MRWFDENLPVMIGTILGTMAHFGNLLLSGKMPSLLHVLGFLMQLGMIVAVAVVVTDFMGLASDSHKMVASGVLAVSAQEIINYIKENGWKRLVRPWMGESPVSGKEDS